MICDGCDGLNQKFLKSPDFCFDPTQATPSISGCRSLNVVSIPQLTVQLCRKATIRTKTVGPPSIYNINRPLVLIAKAH